MAIYRTLLNPDSRYRQLSASAQLAFITLKLLLPFANIERRARWAAEIAENSALSEKQARAALIELGDAGIIEYDGRVLWVIRGLACEPTAMSSKVSAFLIKGLRRHLDNIGTNTIADRFRAHYAALFSDNTETVTPRDPSRDMSRHGSPDPSGDSVGLDIGVKQVRALPIVGDCTTPRAQWLEPITALLRENLGQLSPEVVEQRLAPIAQRDGVERVSAVVRHYFSACPPTFWSLKNLAERYGAFAAQMDRSGSPIAEHGAHTSDESAAFVSPSQYLRELALGQLVLTGGSADD